MVPLSERTRKRVHALFVGPSAAEAERLLAEKCAESVPLWSENSPHGLERLRFAAIRLSGGELPRLVDSIELAHKDWRDLLDAARFAESVWSHRFWTPRRFDNGVATRWRKGERIAKVGFALGQAVKVSLGPYRSAQGLAGTVTELMGLEPEPRYKVSLEKGESVELLQCHVKAAG
jgi:hypothetical protein